MRIREKVPATPSAALSHPEKEPVTQPIGIDRLAYSPFTIFAKHGIGFCLGAAFEGDIPGSEMAFGFNLGTDRIFYQKPHVSLGTGYLDLCLYPLTRAHERGVKPFLSIGFLKAWPTAVYGYPDRLTHSGDLQYGVGVLSGGDFPFYAMTRYRSTRLRIHPDETEIWPFSKRLNMSGPVFEIGVSFYF